MKILFHKYQATGNDFVLIDNRLGHVVLSVEDIRKLCHRKFGIGADGLMLIETHPTLDFSLVYYNSDGSQSLCGNGSRAAVAMAAALGMVKERARFLAYDGEHEAELLPHGQVKLKMNPVAGVKQGGDTLFIHTGSPHHLQWVADAEAVDVYREGRDIRYSTTYQPQGTNVNFIEPRDGTIAVRTYERGVEDETLSCGTGVTAAALAAHFRGYTSPVTIKTRGGELSVAFEANDKGGFDEIYLIGPAEKVFEGAITLPSR
ncbi:MAG: diaminopimelate epimerase [Cyclobacteriaceae bacterium]|nr:diaminopimelate epimerase [Cyclobacteriaceae bacterium]